MDEKSGKRTPERLNDDMLSQIVVLKSTGIMTANLVTTSTKKKSGNKEIYEKDKEETKS